MEFSCDSHMPLSLEFGDGRRINQGVDDKVPLSERQISHLRGLAHHLKPTVTVGQQGLHAAVLSELDQALLAHELLKVKVGAADRDQRRQLIEQMAAAAGADVVQRIGGIAVLFRRNPKRPRVALPTA